MGAVCGLGVGLAQGFSVPMRDLDRWLWVASTPVLWAVGWLITLQVIVDAERQHAMFGASGALFVSAVTGVLVALRRPFDENSSVVSHRHHGLGRCVVNRLAGFVVRHRRAVIASWIIALIVTAAIGSSAFSVLSSEFGAGTSTESGRVAQRPRRDRRDGWPGRHHRRRHRRRRTSDTAARDRWRGVDRGARRRDRCRRSVVERTRRSPLHRRSGGARRGHPGRRPRRRGRTRRRQSRSRISPIGSMRRRSSSAATCS